MKNITLNEAFKILQDCSAIILDDNFLIFDMEDIEEWKNGKFVSYSNGTILNYLCKMGFIKKGEYLVGVC